MSTSAVRTNARYFKIELQVVSRQGVKCQATGRVLRRKMRAQLNGAREHKSR